MSDVWVRHMIAVLGTLVTALAWWSGYFSGSRGWWWTVLWMLVIYVAIYKLVDA